MNDDKEVNLARRLGETTPIKITPETTIHLMVVLDRQHLYGRHFALLTAQQAETTARIVRRRLIDHRVSADVFTCHTKFGRG